MMLHHVDPSQVEVFQAANESKFNSSAIGILSPAFAKATEPSSRNLPHRIAPETSAGLEIDPAIDVEAAATTEAPFRKPTVATPIPGADIEGLLNKLSIPSIRSPGIGSRSRHKRNAGKHSSEVKGDRHRV